MPGPVSVTVNATDGPTRVAAIDDTPAARRVAERVGHQVVHRLLQAMRIAVHLIGRMRRTSHVDGHAGLRRHRLVAARHLVQQTLRVANTRISKSVTSFSRRATSSRSATMRSRRRVSRSSVAK